MVQVEFKLKLGQDEFVIKADVSDEKDFFQKMSFYSNLPRTAPGGATDLKVRFKTTKKGHKYYSLVSETEKMEFKLGQALETNGGGLFPKGWEPLYTEADSNEDEANDELASPVIATAPIKPTVKPMAKVVAPAPAAAPVASPSVKPATPQSNPAAANILARFGVKN